MNLRAWISKSPMRWVERRQFLFSSSRPSSVMDIQCHTRKRHSERVQAIPKTLRSKDRYEFGSRSTRNVLRSLPEGRGPACLPRKFVDEVDVVHTTRYELIDLSDHH